MSYTPTIGTVSHGTLRNEDLLSAFSYELQAILESETHSGQIAHLSDLIAEIEKCDLESENAFELVGDAIDTLNDYAPSYCYFGAHNGDGSDFGYWPDFEALADAVRDGEVMKVSDLSEIPPNYRGEIMLVNDHGNVTFGYVDYLNGEFKSVWDCV